MSPILGIWASSISGAVADPGAFVPIATTTVPSAGAATITFSSIPSTYTHLQIRGIARGTSGGASDISVRVGNGTVDSGSNYSFHQLFGDGVNPAASASASLTAANIAYAPSASQTASVFGSSVIDILDYANTNKYKTFRGLSGWDNNGSGYSLIRSSVWLSTSAINIITLFSASNLAQYSSFTLYGIKG